MEAVGASLKTGFCRHLCLLPFKLAALVLLMMAPAQAAMQQADCASFPLGYGQQSEDGGSTLSVLRAASHVWSASDDSRYDGDPVLGVPGFKQDLRADVVSTPFGGAFSVTHAVPGRAALASKRAPPHKV